jgi:hypothetical protein
MYSDPGTLTGGSAKTFLMQHAVQGSMIVVGGAA